jgi:hypothetical protein
VYYYMRSLCWKKLGRLDLARKDYEVVMKNGQPSNYNFLSNYLMSMVFSKVRRLNLQFDSLSYLRFRETLVLTGLDETDVKKVEKNPLMFGTAQLAVSNVTTINSRAK